MNSFMNTLRSRVEKRAIYRQTVRELRAMPHSVALDLGIFTEDAEKIARRTVYGDA